MECNTSKIITTIHSLDDRYKFSIINWELRVINSELVKANINYIKKNVHYKTHTKESTTLVDSTIM